MTSRANMAAESDILSEIEVLQSIYLDELDVAQKDEGGWTVSLVLYPSTAEDCLSQFVRLTLTMDLESQYPSSSPSISIQNPRGLSDDKLHSLQESLQKEAEGSVGTPVLYQLIERAKEILTESNIPHGNCVICLYGFKEGEVFTKTQCYHYFHSHCLGRYVRHSEMELKDRERELEEDKTRDRAEEEKGLAVVCPVCREPLTYDLESLLSTAAPVFSQEDTAICGDFKKKWETFQKILERQKEKGGVIDPEEESNRFLIHINEAPANLPSLVMETSGAESCQSLPASFPESACANLPPHDVHSTGQAQHQSTHYKRQPADFKRGRRGRGRGGGRDGSVCHMMPGPGVEPVGRIPHSSDKIKYVNSGSINNTLQVEGAAQGQAREQSDKSTDLCEPLPNDEAAAVSPNRVSAEAKCGQEVSQEKECIAKEVTRAILQERPREKEYLGGDRGERHGSHCSGRYRGHWQERNFKGSGHWENTVISGHRGGANRAREGGAGRYHRGGRAYRGSGGRGVHQRVEKEFRKEGVL